MQASEYGNLDRVEREHWYYAGKREIVGHWIDSCHALRPDDTLLDFGAGTGFFASTLLGRCNVRAFDSYPESLEILRKRLPSECVIEPDGPRIPVADASVDCVTALDVLEHLPDDSGAATELGRVLKPGGLVVITVPADMKLWSDWDVSLHHFRRYDRRQLESLFDPEHWDVVHCAYTNTFAYPAVYCARKLRNNTPPSAARAEDKVPWPWLNAFLRFLFVAPAKARWFPAFFGVSLLLVARKR